MIEASMTRYPEDFGPLAQEVHELPGRYRRAITKEVLPQVRKYARLLTSKYPGPTKHPFQFATPKSRKWFFANVPAPYIRTKFLQESWDVQVTLQDDDAFEMTMSNSASYAEPVYGPRQVPGHRITGWRPLKDTYQKVIGYTEGKSKLAWDKLTIRNVP